MGHMFTTYPLLKFLGCGQVVADINYLDGILDTVPIESSSSY